MLSISLNPQLKSKYVKKQLKKNQKNSLLEINKKEILTVAREDLVSLAAKPPMTETRLYLSKRKKTYV